MYGCGSLAPNISYKYYKNFDIPITKMEFNYTQAVNVLTKISG